MFIRNGIKSILRERGRTVLFSLLIMLLTVMMILSLSVLLYSKAMMVACDEAYRSIALIEYMGSEYPSEDEPDAAARAAAKELSDETIFSVDGVMGWSRGNTSFASAEGFERTTGTMPYRNKAVIIVSQVSDPIIQWVKFNTNGEPIIDEGSITYYTCYLKTALYTRSIKEGTYIDIIQNNTGFVPEKGKSYVLNGSFVDPSGSARQRGDYPLNGYSVFQVESFMATDELPYAGYVEGDKISDVFLQAADQYRTMNNYVYVVPCHDVNDVYAFHQNELELIAGDMPNPGTPNACVLTNDLATSLGVSPGDTFSMNELCGTEDDQYKHELTGEEHTFTVSGIVGDSPDFYGTVWVISEAADTPLFGYLLGTVSLRNEGAEVAVETLQEIVPEQVRVTLLNQGYTSVVQPFKEVEKTAENVLLICSVGIVAVLMLFAFLFVGRQHSTVRIMVSMGTPSRNITQWFLSGAMVVCGAATILGTLLGTVLRPVIFYMITKFAAGQMEEGGNWYSETALDVVKQTAFDPQVPYWPNLIVAPGIVVLALLFCLQFLRMACKGEIRKRGKSKVRIPHGKTSKLNLRGLGFALLSIRRGGLRSLVVPLVSFVLTVAVLFLSGIYQGWQNELNEAKKNESIEGMVVSQNGRYYSGLAVYVKDVRAIFDIEGVDDISVSFGYKYWLPEDEPSFTYGAFGREHRLEWIATQPELVALNSLSAAKEFYYIDPSVTWLEGWDETALVETDVTPLQNRREDVVEQKLIPAVCSTTFLEDHNMVLGDTFASLVQVEYNKYGNIFLKEIPLNLQVVGSYVQQGGKAQIYVPLACHFPPSLLAEDDDSNSISIWDSVTFRTCRFYLSSAGTLDEVRQLLRNQGFSAVGHISSNRTTLLLRDSAFLTLAENMERNITMGKVMSTVISFLIVLLGFIISWLMIYTRRQEFALMRGFGVQKQQVFAAFFMEQAILSLSGCLTGCIVLFWLYAGGLAQPLAATTYLICYLLGAAISIKMIGKINLMELLTIRE